MLKPTVAIPAKEVVFIIRTVHLLMYIFEKPAGKGIKDSTTETFLSYKINTFCHTPKAVFRLLGFTVKELILLHP